MPRSTVSVRARLLRNVVAIILVLGGAILITMFAGTRRVVRELSETIVGQTLETVEARLENFFSAPVLQLETTRGQAMAGLFDDRPGQDDASTQDRRSHHFVPLIEAYPQISSLMLADQGGGESMLLRTETGWRHRVMDPAQSPGEAIWLEWEDGAPKPLERRESTEYDPRIRPWYAGALTSRPGVHWTKPYTFFTTQEPGITVSTAYAGPDGRDHVIGFDLLLRDISEFTLNMRVGERGIIAVLTDDRRLVGLPRDAQFDDPDVRARAYLKTPPELGLSVVSDASIAFGVEAGTGNGLGTVRFESGGEAWWCKVIPFHLSDDTALRIAIAVPEADLLGSHVMLRTVIGSIILIVLIGAILRAIMMSRRFSIPIELLVEQSERISRGDLTQQEPISTDISELQRLTDAHESMREGLRSLIRLEKLERDLDLARDIQRGLLPADAPDVPGFEIAGWNQAADQTGGDYYDWMTLPGGSTIVTLADVTGHGIGPALISAVCRAYMRASAAHVGVQLQSALQHVNDLLFRDTPPERFVTAVVVAINPADSEVTLVSAGHGPILYYQASTGMIVENHGDTPPLAVIDGLEFPEPHRFVFEPGDVMVLTTDGFFEWMNVDREQYGTRRMIEFLREHHALPGAEFIEKLYASVLEHADGTSQDDDLTAVVIRRV